MQLSLWAPNKPRVDLVVNDTRIEMQPCAERSGYWVAELPASGTVRYGLSIDGGPVLPDPRAQRLPEGVHGRAQRVDVSTFAWTDHQFRARPLSSALLYELHVGTFSEAGTFDGVASRLDHLVELGVTHLCLMPVHSFSGQRGWGYDSVGLFAPHEHYGGPDGLWRLVDACHRRGLAVIADVVYNHLGPDGNYLGHFAPYFTDRVKTPWGQAVNLDGSGSDEVRRFFLDNARMWLEDYHFDGLRLDATHAFHDNSAYHFLEELADEVCRLQARVARPLILIAESDRNDPKTVLPRFAGGHGMDAQWNDELHHTLHCWLTRETLGYYEDYAGTVEELCRCLERGFLYEGAYSKHRGRRHGRPIVDIPSSRFICFSQTHDQVGNRARGERLSHLVGPQIDRVALAIVMFAPMTPMLFAGQEWAAKTPFPYFTDFDGELGAMVRAGRRSEFAEFGWAPNEVPDPQSKETFLSAVLNWDERTEAEHAETHAFARRLISLRQTHADLQEPRFSHLTAEPINGQTIRLRRGNLELLAHIGNANTSLPAVGTTLLCSGGVKDGDTVTFDGPGCVILERSSGD